MNVTLKINGTMERYFPAAEFHLKLGDDATLSDLYQELAPAAAADISPAVWNHKKNRPRGPVIMRSEDRVLKG